MANEPSATILLINDEEDLLELLHYALEREGFTVVATLDGHQGLRLARAHQPDLIVLDIMMPHMDGIEVCERLRKDVHLRLTPILMLSTKSGESDEIMGLEAGADDYLTKPTSTGLLASRIRGLLRRTERSSAAQTTHLRVHDLVIDRGRYIVTRVSGDAEVDLFRLPRKEFELLYFLASHPGTIFSSEELLDSVWGPDVYAVDRTIDVHVRKVREKIGSEYIETIEGVGYKLRADLAS